MKHKIFRLLSLGFKMSWQLVRGGIRLNRIKKPIIAIFGGKNIAVNTPWAQQAHDLGFELVKRGFFMITGGGPGIMEAVHAGAEAHDKTTQDSYSLGMGVTGVDEGFVSPSQRELMVVDFFSVRKWLLIHFAQIVIVFPGGYGTADEFFDTINLLKLRRLDHDIALILVGSAYWQPIRQWIFEIALKQGAIQAGEELLFTVCDTNEEIVGIVDRHMKKQGKRAALQ